MLWRVPRALIRLSSPMQPQEDVARPGMTTAPPSQVAGGGLSSPTQLQADVATALG